ncbi:MAG: threonine synthase, partial [Bacilli bacterium]
IEKPESIVTIGEGWTPLLRLPSLEKGLSVGEIMIKREEQNPSGSFKSRGFSAAVSLLNEYGIRKVAVPSNGNAASALAAYAGRAGMDCYVFVPQDCPPLIVEECIQYGAHTFLVDGYIHDAAAIIEDGKDEQGWFNVGTMKEPGRVEGKKTMGLEIAEQLNWQWPDVILYPTGGGSGIIGLWKAFHELRSLGLVKGDFPRLISVQEEGCQPIVDAMELNAQKVVFPEGTVQSKPTGMRVPNPPGGDLVVSILRETNGTAVAVSSDEISAASKTLGAHGISASPEGAATWAGFERVYEKGLIGANDRVVLFNTSHALKYVTCKVDLTIPTVKNYAEWIQRVKK